MTAITQLERVAAALLEGAEVSPAAAIQYGWGLRLSALIHRLRRRGWPIETHRNHNNGMAHYTLPKGWMPPRPTPPKFGAH
jgi:hypothetical protein